MNLLTSILVLEVVIDVDFHLLSLVLQCRELVGVVGLLVVVVICKISIGGLFILFLDSVCC